MSKLNIGTMLILSILLVSPLKPNGQPAYDRINMSASKSLRLYFYPALSDLDEKTFTLRTNRMILSITSSDANFSFSGVMMYGYQNDPSETRMYCTRIGNYSSSGSHWYSNSYSWNDSGFAFYDRPYPWHLFYTGTFPWDAYHWPIIIGTDLPLTSSDPLQDLGNFPLELTSKWAIDAPRLLPLEGAPNNDTLERLWPGFYARDYCDSEISAMKGTGNWYYFDTVFRRHQVDQTRFGSLFWVPSLGLFATIVGSWGVWGLGKRRKSDFHIRLAEGLTLYLASVLFAFPFILSITQYGPGQITPPEWLFYIDAVLAFASALISLYLEYRWQSARKNDRPSLEEP